MGISIVDLLILGAGVLLLVIWLIFFVKSKKYDSIFESLDEKEYPLKELFSTGYVVMELIHYDYKAKRDRKLRQQLEILYEKKYVEFYIRVIYAQRVAYAMLLVLLAFVIYGMTGEIAAWGILLLFAGLAFYYYGNIAATKIEKRSEEMLRDFSEVVSKLALLTNAGLVLREAWKLVSENGIGVLYEEMQRTMDDMKNGVSEAESIRKFGIRCVIPEIKKFSSTIVQGILRGNKDISVMLKQQSDEVWVLRQQSIKRQGERAAEKLMIPIFIMFIGILIMVIVPIFSNLGV